MNNEIVKEWFEKGDKDIETATFLIQNKKSLEDVGFHIHQAVEKYLKGFLIFHGWELEKIHDLVRLLKEAEKIDESFKEFNQFAIYATGFYVESRYPMGYVVEYLVDELRRHLEQANKIISVIKQKVKL